MSEMSSDPSLNNQNQSHDPMLHGLSTDRHTANVIKIWNKLTGIARLSPEEVVVRARDINHVARDIMFTESQHFNSAPITDLTEISTLFRHAAIMLNANILDPEVAEMFVPPMLDRARDIASPRVEEEINLSGSNLPKKKTGILQKLRLVG